MNNKSRSNALLIELLIVIMFFMLSGTVLIQVFAKAHQLRERSAVKMDALLFAQNTADTLYASEDPELALSQLGFSRTSDGWEKTVEDRDGGFTAALRMTQEKREGGTLSEMEIDIIRGGEILFTLPGVRFREEAP